MKSTIIKACLLTFAGLLIGCAAKQAAAPPAAPEGAPSVDVRLGKLIAVDHTTFTLKNEADTERFEKAVIEIWNPAYARHMPGLQVLFCKGDRGVNTGKYVQISNFDTQERRDYYYPVPDADEYPAHTTAALEPLNAELAEKFEFTLADIVQSDTVRVYTDYVLVGGDQIPEMPLVGLLGIHEITSLKTGMEAAFEAFITDKWYPATLGRIPGYNEFLYKGDRGANIGGYIYVAALDSPSRRDAYWPEPGVASEAWTAATEASPLPEGLGDEFNTYFDPADTTAAGEPVDIYTDWVIIK